MKRRREGGLSTPQPERRGAAKLAQLEHHLKVDRREGGARRRAKHRAQTKRRACAAIAAAAAAAAAASVPLHS